MLKETITYTDLDGNEKTGVFYFHLSKSELLKMDFSEATLKDDQVEGGMVANLKAILARGRGREIIEVFEDLISRSYGVRSEDGSEFIKDEVVTRRFMQSSAYDKFFTEIITDADKAAKFFNSVVPKDISDKMDVVEDTKLEQLRKKLEGKFAEEKANSVAESPPAVTMNLDSSSIGNVTLTPEQYKNLVNGSNN